MKFIMLKRWSARRFDGVVVPLPKDLIIHQMIKGENAWADEDGKLVGCGIETLIDLKLVMPLDDEARKIVTRFKRWKTANREYKKGRRKNSTYIMYGGCGFKLLANI